MRAPTSQADAKMSASRSKLSAASRKRCRQSSRNAHIPVHTSLIGNPRSYGDRGHFGLTTHSTNCTHRTMVRGDHRGKTCQGPYHDPNHDADSRSVVPPEVPKDVR